MLPRSKQTADEHEAEGLSFSATLEQRLHIDPPRRKGDRTRARLKAAAAKVLDQAGYLEMRVTDLCAAADMGVASFYFYYPNKTDITREVLSDFLEEIYTSRPIMDGQRDLFETLVTTNLHVMRWFEANAGLVRCLLQFSDETPEFNQLWQSRSHDWYARIANRMLQSAPEGARIAGDLLLDTYALGGMMDQMFRDLYVHRNGRLKEIVDAAAPTPEALARKLARLWYRGAFGLDPEAVQPPRREPA